MYLKSMSQLEDENYKSRKKMDELKTLVLNLETQLKDAKNECNFYIFVLKKIVNRVNFIKSITYSQSFCQLQVIIFGFKFLEFRINQ